MVFYLIQWHIIINLFYKKNNKMKLIKLLESRRDKMYKLVKWGLFYCSFCFKEKAMILSNGKKAKSCGCQRGIKHNGIKTRLYNIWKSMKQRCFNIKHINYKYYGGRGITICPEWTDKLNGFINFRNWALNNGYLDNLEIDRRNPDGNYEPNNCQWVTHKENVRNQRNIKISSEKANEIRELYKTGYYTQKDIGEKYNIKKNTISQIVSYKRWSNI